MPNDDDLLEDRRYLKGVFWKIVLNPMFLSDCRGWFIHREHMVDLASNGQQMEVQSKEEKCAKVGQSGWIFFPF